MRIVHFSDIHAYRFCKDIGALFDKRALGTLYYFIHRRYQHNWDYVEKAVAVIQSLKPDVVICTGDLTTIGLPEEFEKSANALQPLIDDNRTEFLYVPGNHDYYVRNKKYFHALKKTFKRLNRGRWELQELPVRWSFRECSFILLNQACPAPPWASYGMLDHASQDWIKENAAYYKGNQILVNHFPVYDALGKSLSWRRRCRENMTLRRAFDKGAFRIALCGHIHTPFIRHHGNNTYEICAGSLTKNGIINCMDISGSDFTMNQQWVSVDIFSKKDL